jgi:aminopeptidase N
MLGFATLNPTYKHFSFCNGNPSQFHAADGSGYAYWTEQVIALNKLNPQVAARLVRTLDT